MFGQVNASVKTHHVVLKLRWKLFRVLCRRIKGKNVDLNSL